MDLNRLDSMKKEKVTAENLLNLKMVVGFDGDQFILCELSPVKKEKSKSKVFSFLLELGAVKLQDFIHYIKRDPGAAL